MPAVFGIPWSDPHHLTVSFVPDGTHVDGVASNLFQVMPGASSAWTTQILRALQTWASSANVNISVVGDSGAAIGAAGDVQGDDRFGDIRICARPLSENVLAITNPPGYFGGTRSGDIVLNSNKVFSIGGGGSTYDLYSVLLQEGGHALGVGNSTDVNSPMYENYSGVRSGLIASDVANIRSLNGARTNDSFENNDTLSAAKELRRPAGLAPNTSIVAMPTLASSTDIDWFKVKTGSAESVWHDDSIVAFEPASRPSFAVRSGRHDAAGNGSVRRSGRRGPLFLLSSVQANQFYFIKIEAVNPSFAAGSYTVKSVFDPAAPDARSVDASSLLDDGPIQTKRSTTISLELNTTVGYADKTHYNSLGLIRDAVDIDFYKFRSANVGANNANVMTINLRSLDPLLGAWSKVFDLRAASRRLLDSRQCRWHAHNSSAECPVGQGLPTSR